MELSKVANVIAGYAFRGAIKPDPSGEVSVFQAKDLVQGEPFYNVSSLTRIAHAPTDYSGHLRKDDVLVVARGMKSGAFRSTVFATDEPNVIASSSVHIIRITSSEVSPGYLSLYLNSREGQLAIADIVSGSYIGAVPRRELEKIDIPMLSLDKQKLLIDLFRNIREQQKILEREKELKENIINATFKSLTTK